MSNLHTAIEKYKQRAISEILENDALVTAIDPHAESPDDLVYKNIFPFFRVPTADTETTTYLAICMDYPEVYHPENMVRRIALKICIIVHQDLMQTDYGATRLDYIASRCDDIFLGSSKYGFGKLLLLSSTETSLTQFHRARELIYVSNESQGSC